MKFFCCCLEANTLNTLQNTLTMSFIYTTNAQPHDSFQANTHWEVDSTHMRHAVEIAHSSTRPWWILVHRTWGRTNKRSTVNWAGTAPPLNQLCPVCRKKTRSPAGSQARPSRHILQLAPCFSFPQMVQRLVSCLPCTPLKRVNVFLSLLCCQNSYKSAETQHLISGHSRTGCHWGFTIPLTIK